MVWACCDCDCGCQTGMVFWQEVGLGSDSPHLAGPCSKALLATGSGSSSLLVSPWPSCCCWVLLPLWACTLGKCEEQAGKVSPS
jgi:hypothetical protein